jgi:hypothetical protein
MSPSAKPSGSFLVKDSKGASFIAGLVFLAMFITAILYRNDQNSQGWEFNIAYLTIIPAIIFIVRGFKDKIVIEINENGLFYHGALVTNWTHFITAKYEQEEKVMSLQDNFILLIDYYKPETGKRYTSKIKLPSILNKSEEDIIAAIQRFCTDSNKNKV